MVDRWGRSGQSEFSLLPRARSPVARSRSLLPLAGVLLLASTGPLLAQGADCDRLQAAIDATGPTGGGGQDQYARAAERQRAEIARTRDYEASVGCGNPAYGGLNETRPEQCGGIETHLARMEDNLAQIEARERQLGEDGGRRARLLAQFDAACSRGATAPDEGEGRDAADLRVAPLDPDDLSTVPPGGDISGGDEPGSPHAGQAICVRTCDGGFFPLGLGASHDRGDSLEQLCKASCPNAEAHLYTMVKADELDSATSIDGEAYAALPTAHRFEKSFNPSCSCKPPGQSWAQALAEAEGLIEAHEGDVTVTARMSETMAKAATPPAQPAAKGKSRKRADKAPATLPDVAAASEGLRAAESPTASTASAGIGPSPDAADPAVVKQGEGPTREVQGRDGIRRTVRVIAP